MITEYQGLTGKTPQVS